MDQAFANCGGSQEDIVDTYMGVVKTIANDIHQRLPANIDFESLVQSGIVGLLEAARRYNPNSATRFASFAHWRIYGEIIGYLRSIDHVSRYVRRWGRASLHARARLLALFGREPTSEEHAAAMGVPLEFFYRWEAKVEHASPVSLDAPAVLLSYQKTWRAPPSLDIPDTRPDPALGVEEVDLVKKTHAAMDSLTNREQLIVNLFYEEEMTLLEIGRKIGRTEGRISQILKEVHRKLRNELAL